MPGGVFPKGCNLTANLHLWKKRSPRSRRAAKRRETAAEITLCFFLNNFVPLISISEGEKAFFPSETATAAKKGRRKGELIFGSMTDGMELHRGGSNSASGIASLIHWICCDSIGRTGEECVRLHIEWYLFSTSETRVKSYDSP